MTTATERAQREGILVQPVERLNEEQIRLVDSVSRELLAEPGLLCYNAEAVKVFESVGAKIEKATEEGCARVRLSDSLIDQALDSAPSTVVLGARNPDNRLVLDAHEPRVRFGSGSETNVWLDVSFDGDRPVYARHEGSIERLKTAAHLADQLEHLDFFIRCVNICDAEVTAQNKDVNKFFASLDNITKHVQAGLTDLGALDDVMRLGHIVAGGEDAFRENPVLSFIACVVKSPLQIVEDTAATFMEISRRRAPIVVSSCPMGGATGPFDEFGMVAQINAELLAGICLNQFTAPGAPILYGAVPVRTRLDNLNDMYGAPEVVRYNFGCSQMARHYGLPCYSTAGVGDTELPGIQATAEKMMTLTNAAWSGAQYVHYAFGLLERTNTFCPEQAILDDAHIGAIKGIFLQDQVLESKKEAVLGQIREVMETGHKSFVYHLPSPQYEPVYVRYPLEHPEGGALRGAHEKYQEILERPRNQIPEKTRQEITERVPGILPACLKG